MGRGQRKSHWGGLSVKLDKYTCSTDSWDEQVSQQEDPVALFSLFYTVDILVPSVGISSWLCALISTVTLHHPITIITIGLYKPILHSL